MAKRAKIKKIVIDGIETDCKVYEIKYRYNRHMYSKRPMKCKFKDSRRAKMMLKTEIKTYQSVDIGDPIKTEWSP